MPSGIQVPECESRPPFRSASLLMQLWRGGPLPFLSSMKDQEHTRKKTSEKGGNNLFAAFCFHFPPCFAAKKMCTSGKGGKQEAEVDSRKKRGLGGKERVVFSFFSPPSTITLSPPSFLFFLTRQSHVFQPFICLPRPLFPFLPYRKRKRRKA